MNRILWIAIVILMLLPDWAVGKDSLTDAELSGTSATAGLALKLYGDKILDDPNLTQEEAEKLWQEMTPEKREAARQNFRQELMEMPPEERAEIRQQVLERFLSLSPEEQETVRTQMRDRVQEMSPEEQSEYMKFRGQMLQSSDAMSPDGRPGNNMFNGMRRGPMR